MKMVEKTNGCKSLDACVEAEQLKGELLGSEAEERGDESRFEEREETKDVEAAEEAEKEAEENC